MADRPTDIEAVGIPQQGSIVTGSITRDWQTVARLVDRRPPVPSVVGHSVSSTGGWGTGAHWKR